MTRARSAGNFIDGDAAIAGAHTSRRESEDLHHTGGSSAPPPPRAISDRIPPTKRKEAPKENRATVADGKYVTSRNGLQICRGYNEGSCTGQTSNGRCKQNHERVHCCWFCLNIHPATACSHSSAPSAPALSKSQKYADKKRKGKGKGK